MEQNRIKDDFPILNNKDISYLDSGATTQKPECVLEAVNEYYRTSNANPHRGAYSLSIEATRLYDESREKFSNRETLKDEMKKELDIFGKFIELDKKTDRFYSKYYEDMETEEFE